MTPTTPNVFANAVVTFVFQRYRFRDVESNRTKHLHMNWQFLTSARHVYLFYMLPARNRDDRKMQIIHTKKTNLLKQEKRTKLMVPIPLEFSFTCTLECTYVIFILTTYESDTTNHNMHLIYTLIN